MSTDQAILICVRVKETRGFPGDYQGRSFMWMQIYPGIFSPDGLERHEKGPARSAANFQSNINPDTVLRSTLDVLPSWSSTAYWPIVVCPTLTMMFRQTTLNEQRYMQMVQAVKLLLQENSSRNPIGLQLTPADVERRVVVCFVGGSNGGLQGEVAALRYPHIVGGFFSEVFNPSMQRFYGEHAMGHAVARLSGGGFIGAGITAVDYLHWNQYFWSQGIEAHDASYLRLFLAGQVLRPGCFLVGDEDITSTGVDWAKVLHGTQWASYGERKVSTPLGTSLVSAAWSVAPMTCHTSAVVPVVNPYTGTGSLYQTAGLVHELFEEAVRHHGNIGTVPPPPAPVHTARTPAQELRGLDDVHEWFLGREGDAMPTVSPTTDPLVRDDTFFAAAQPGTAGTAPGRREAMVIHQGSVYVGSADGLVSKFSVDFAVGQKQRLKLDRQSTRLGHEVSGLLVVGSELVVATRRHLRKLSLATLAQVPNSLVQLPWEFAEPHHLALADVLPGSPGGEIVFASVHGGLVFYDTNLVFRHRWPEPGIIDFRIQGSTVTILSARGVLANVTFHFVGTQHVAQLEAVSQSIPAQLRTPGASPEPPCQGGGSDLELMRLNWSVFGYGVPVAAISLWNGDEDGLAVRSHWLTDLSRLATVPVDQTSPPPPMAQFPTGSAPFKFDVATCTEAGAILGGDAQIGDHMLVLAAGSNLRLYDQFGGLVGEKNLTQSQQGYYPFGHGAHTLCVGELVSNAGAAYQEEVVIATETGLMWMHVQDVAGTSVTVLPATSTTGTPAGSWASGYWIDSLQNQPAGTNTQIQARTNQTLSSAWALARRPVTGGAGFDSDLHVLDQHGAYWRVDHAGTARLQSAPSGAHAGAQGWGYVGAITQAGSGFGIGSPPRLLFSPLPPAGGLFTTVPWRPRVSSVVAYEQGPPGTPYYPFNWSLSPFLRSALDGFIIHTSPGSVVLTPNGHESWSWTGFVGGGSFDAWGNMVEGLRITGATVDGCWASTHEPTGGQHPTDPERWDRCPYHRFRSYFDGVAVMNQQATHAVRLQTGTFAGQTVVVLGCSGGKVAVLSPGAWRTNNTTPHGFGSVDVYPVDFGFGGGALAVRHEVSGSTERLVIWLGTLVHPTARPSQYANAASSLGFGEEATGAVVRLEWVPGTGSGTGFQQVVGPIALSPTSTHPRGAYGVVGLCETDLPAWPGRELLVATMSGDLIVMDASNLQEHWRTHLDGSIGFYNSIMVANLNVGADNLDEVYVAGSKGLWRFYQQGEVIP